MPGFDVGQVVYRKLEWPDIEQFIELRKAQLQEEGAEVHVDLTGPLMDYYRRHLTDGSFVAWLAVYQNAIIATSGMSFVEKPPHYGNPSGRFGILSSMYTLRPYRRRGIARALLGHVVEEARRHGCGAVEITGTEIGSLLYQSFGFKRHESFFRYQLR